MSYTSSSSPSGDMKFSDIKQDVKNLKKQFEEEIEYLEKECVKDIEYSASGLEQLLLTVKQELSTCKQALSTWKQKREQELSTWKQEQEQKQEQKLSILKQDNEMNLIIMQDKYDKYYYDKYYEEIKRLIIEDYEKKEHRMIKGYEESKHRMIKGYEEIEHSMIKRYEECRSIHIKECKRLKLRKIDNIINTITIKRYYEECVELIKDVEELKNSYIEDNERKAHETTEPAKQYVYRDRIKSCKQQAEEIHISLEELKKSVEQLKQSTLEEEKKIHNLDKLNQIVEIENTAEAVSTNQPSTSLSTAEEVLPRSNLSNSHAEVTDSTRER